MILAGRKVRALMGQAQRQFGVEVSKIMACRARAKATKVVLGNNKEQYRRIRDYCHTVIDKNPDSVVSVATVPRVDQ